MENIYCITIPARIYPYNSFNVEKKRTRRIKARKKLLHFFPVFLLLTHTYRRGFEWMSNIKLYAGIYRKIIVFQIIFFSSFFTVFFRCSLCFFLNLILNIKKNGESEFVPNFYSTLYYEIIFFFFILMSKFIVCRIMNLLFHSLPKYACEEVEGCKNRDRLCILGLLILNMY